MQQAKMDFNINKLNYFTELDDLGWAWDLRYERKKQFEKNVKWLSRLLDRYTKL